MGEVDFAEVSDELFVVEDLSHPVAGGGDDGSAQVIVGKSSFNDVGQGVGVFRGTEQAGLFVGDEFGHAGDVGGGHGNAGGHGFGHHVGDAVAVAVCGLAAAQGEAVGFAEHLDDRVVGDGAGQFGDVGEAEFVDQGADIALHAFFALAHQGKAEVEAVGAELGQGAQDDVDALFFHEPGHGQDAVGRRGFERTAVEGEEVQVDAVVHAVDGLAVGRDPGQMVGVVLGAGDHELGQVDLVPDAARVLGVDVLGVGSEGERHVREAGRAHGHGGRRMGEVSVQVAQVHALADDGLPDDVAALEQVLDPGVLLGRELEARQHELDAPPVAAWMAQDEEQVVPEQRGQSPDHGGGKVGDPGLDLFDRVVGEIFSGRAHGVDVDVEPHLLQQADFIGDEGLGNAGIALEHHPQRPAGGSALSHDSSPGNGPAAGT